MEADVIMGGVVVGQDGKVLNVKVMLMNAPKARISVNIFVAIRVVVTCVTVVTVISFT